MIVISIAKDFTRTPGPRYREEGSFSGEEFRRTILVEKANLALTKGEVLFVDLDGTAGYGTSFLEESFGGLIREENLKYADLIKILKIKSDEKPKYSREIDTYLKRADEKASEAIHN
jgi:hypothetical protein